MADEELKSMIFNFRVNELTALLSFAGRNKQGRKTELQARALELLSLNSYPVFHKIRELYQSYQASLSGTEEGDNIENIENINNTMQQPNRGGYLPTYPGQSMNAVSRERAAMYAAANVYHQYQTQVKQAVPIHPSSTYPIHPDVKLKKLPFYEMSAELIKPSSLVPQGSQRQQDSQYVFHLTPQQATAIGMSRDMRPGSKVEYAVQVQLRFCLLETTSEQEDCFPPGVIVKVNGRMCQLPNPIPTNKPGVEPKRPPRPVNITPLVKISPTVTNSIHVQWSTDYTRGYVLAVYLVHKKTSDDLLNRLKAKGVRGADYTRGMIKDKLNEDADSEIATTSLRVSLVCPLGKMRMTFPCRASTCNHLQCFDAGLYLQMNERKPTWVCPVCDKPAVYDKLVIDGYFQDVLSSGRLLNDGNEIQLNSDGSWSSLCVKKEKKTIGDQLENTPVKPEPKFEMLEVEPEAAPAASVAPATSSNNETAPPKKKEVIDLTLSDSDDEPLVPKKKVTPDSSLQNIRYTNNVSAPNSVSSSGQHSPSLIILDSDSPPSTPTPSTPTPATPGVQVSPRSYSAASTASCHSYLQLQPHFLDVEGDPGYNRY